MNSTKDLTSKDIQNTLAIVFERSPKKEPPTSPSSPPENSTPANLSPQSSVLGTIPSHPVPPVPPVPPENPRHPTSSHEILLGQRQMLEALACAGKPHPEDKLQRLSDQDKEQLMTWLDELSFTDAAKKVAQPRPEGLGIQTSRSALHRFYHKHNLREKIDCAVEVMQSITPNSETAPIHHALQMLVHTHAIQLAAGPEMNQAALQFLTRFVTRLNDQQIRDRALDLHQKRLAYEMQKWSYDIVAQTIELLPELNEIVQNKKLTASERFHKSYVKVFGEDAARMVEKANRRYRENHPTTPDTDPKPDLKVFEPKLDFTERSHQFFAQLADERAAQSPGKFPETQIIYSEIKPEEKQ